MMFHHSMPPPPPSSMSSTSLEAKRGVSRAHTWSAFDKYQMEGVLCGMCMKPFDLGDRLPKGLACGHTYCVSCLRTRKPKTCLIDGTRFTKSGDQLPVNYTLYEVFQQLNGSTSSRSVEAVAVQTDNLPDVVPADSKDGVRDTKPTKEEINGQLHFWCLECGKDASIECIDEHRVQSLRAVRAARYTQARSQIDALSSAEVSLARLKDLLEAAVREVEPELQTCRGRLRDEEGVLAQARDSLEAALIGEAAEWEQAKEKVPEYALCTQAAQFLADLSCRDVTCSLTVAAEGDAGAAGWKGSVALSGTALAKLLLCRALLQGGLERQALQAEDPKQRQREEERLQRELGRLQRELERLQREEQERLQLERERLRRQEEERLQREQQERLEREREERLQQEREQRERDLKAKKEREEQLLEDLEYESSAVAWEERPNDVGPLGVEEMSARIRKGCHVGPGRDWAGGPGLHLGFVKEVRGGRAAVRWTNKHGVSEYCIGEGGVHCLRLKCWMPCVHTQKRFNLHPVLDVLELSSGHNIEEKTALLASGTLQELRSLKRLRCQVSPAWAERVLEQVAPRLETLVVDAPGVRHLSLIRDMPHLSRLAITSDVRDATLPLHLEELYFKSVTPQQFAQVAQMPRLKRLQVHCTFASPLPAVSFPRSGLQWLRTGVYPLSTAMGLVRANAATLEQLELVAASHAPYGCPDLAHELRRCKLKCLKRLVLLRNSVNGFCQHDAASCEQQKVDLWTVLVEARCLPSVQCSVCDVVE